MATNGQVPDLRTAVGEARTDQARAPGALGRAEIEASMDKRAAKDLPLGPWIIPADSIADRPNSRSP